MQLGAHTFGFVWHSDAESALVAIAEAGFKQVQLMATPPHFDPWSADPARTTRLRRILERNGMELLARHPDQRAELVADLDLLPAAIEEMLRREPPTQTSARQTTRDVSLHGVTVPADTRVLLMWGAANLDEREFADPDAFDIHRNADRHLSLGQGAHFCMGSAVARLEARVAFEELLACMPDFGVVGSLERIRSSWAWGFESLKVDFEAQPAYSASLA